MTYPEPLYHGQGEASAALRRADAPRQIDYGEAGGVRYLATGATTGGLFGLYRWEMGPAPAGPAPHFHRTMSESFYVLEGIVRIYDGVRWNECGPGDFVHVPPGGVHGFRNESGAPASMLLHFAPGAPREAYFEGFARFGEMGEEERAAFYAAHDQYWA